MYLLNAHIETIQSVNAYVGGSRAVAFGAEDPPGLRWATGRIEASTPRAEWHWHWQRWAERGESPAMFDCCVLVNSLVYHFSALDRSHTDAVHQMYNEYSIVRHMANVSLTQNPRHDAL